MPRGNPSPKLAITVDPGVHRLVVDAAATEGVSVSAWLTEAARRRLRVQDGLLGVTEWEHEHGPLTDAEMEDARASVAGLIAAAGSDAEESASRRRPTPKRTRARRSTTA